MKAKVDIAKEGIENVEKKVVNVAPEKLLFVPIQNSVQKIIIIKKKCRENDWNMRDVSDTTDPVKSFFTNRKVKDKSISLQ